ncbi:NAD(P)H-dependent oxidoreductase [Flavobacterium sp. K5-23]|uniref:NAD(P)H-dependent oxidoreductase n=1 Tax=Flavobacterium sp. K5-23 TaxID=2746225 RepID=UPI002010168D|nr:NAD(P)H-dependent oxidoreductase [Flavobacterium sp. K5-23]UQD56599.1 NAD(P)H-dependent oxidoreductase [Flavobacterium sp. K5-23]
MSNFIKDANWRYATKKFDTTKKIATDDLNTLKEAVRLSASSYGLQLYKVLIIENPVLRAQLLPAAYGQTQITEASHLFVFANQTNVGNTEIDAYLKNASEIRELPIEALAGYGDFMKGTINPMPEDAKNIWTSKQTYLALGNLLNAAAELNIDSTPMEGFNASQFNEILGLEKLNLNAVVIAPVGYRHEEDATQHYKKVRKSNTELFITL